MHACLKKGPPVRHGSDENGTKRLDGALAADAAGGTLGSVNAARSVLGRGEASKGHMEGV